MANPGATISATEPKQTQKGPEKVHTWPHLVAKEFLCALLFLVVILLYSYYIDAPLRELANPGEPENPAKAPWYFLGLQEELVYFDPWFAGVVLPFLIIIGLMLVPYIDPNPRGNGYYTFWERPFSVTVFCFGFLLWYVLIIIGVYCRGPFWAWFWPWEEWTLAFPTPPPLWSLPSPVGFVLLVAYFGLGMWWPAKKWRSFYEELGPIRYGITMFLLLTMIGSILKIGLRLGFEIKYVFQTPWFNI
jgi:hypothetical protein